MKVPHKVLNTYILNSCFSKKAYPSEEEADTEALRIAGKFKSNKMKAYHCRVCKKYHLTNKKGTQDPARVDVTNLKIRSVEKYKTKEVPPDTKKCAHCSKEIVRDNKINDHNWTNKKYCSKTCSWDAKQSRVWYNKKN